MGGPPQQQYVVPNGQQPVVQVNFQSPSLQQQYPTQQGAPMQKSVEPVAQQQQMSMPPPPQAVQQAVPLPAAPTYSNPDLYAKPPQQAPASVAVRSEVPAHPLF